MQLSKTMLTLSPSPTVALNGKAKAMRAAGKEVLNFAVGEPDFSTPQAIRDIGIKAIRDGKTKYGPAGGSPQLRQAIADKLQKDNDLTFDPDDIVCGIGAKEILLHIFMGILNRDDEVILTAPHWVSYTEQIKACGAKPVIVPPPPDMAKQALDLSAIKAAITDKTTGFVLNSPNNPAGYVLAKEDLVALGNLLKEYPNI